MINRDLFGSRVPCKFVHIPYSKAEEAKLDDSFVRKWMPDFENGVAEFYRGSYLIADTKILLFTWKSVILIAADNNQIQRQKINTVL